MDVWFFLKSRLIIHLNHSIRIINEQVMAKIRTLAQTEKQNTYGTHTKFQHSYTKHRIKGNSMLILTKLEFFNSISFKHRVRINS